MAQISLENINVIYPNQNIALEEINLNIFKGEFVFLTGRNGAGKTTLLQTIAGLQYPTSGEVWVDNTDVYHLKGKRLQLFRRKFGIMHTELGLLPDKSVYDNLYFVMRALGLSRRKANQEIPELLRQMGIPHRIQTEAHLLSGGETAKVLLARALLMQPEIIIADEPTANLDLDSSWDIMCLLEDINRKRGTTILLATHDREMVTIMQKRVITMVAGRIVADERKAIYNVKAADIFEERRILHERSKRDIL